MLNENLSKPLSETVNNLFWKLVCFVHAWDTQEFESEPF